MPLQRIIGMPRPKVILSSEYPYHIWVRSNNQDWFDLPPEYCYSAFTKTLKRTKEMYDLETHLFLLMSNHFHMICSTPKANLSPSMRYFLTESSRKIRDRSLRTNHVFGGRYKSNLIRTDIYYCTLFKYILRNPVRAKMVEKVEDYSWSTWRDSSNTNSRLISSAEGYDQLVPKNSEDLLTWLNTPFANEIEENIRKGLRKSEFSLPIDRKTQKQIDITSELPAFIKHRIHKK